jgi:ribosomal protein S27E
MITTEEFKFACPLCHQHIAYDLDTAGVQIQCPGCSETIVVPKSTKTTGTKLMLQGAHTKVKPTLPMSITASSRAAAMPHPHSERASMLLLAAAVTVVLIIAGVIFYH